MRNIFRSQKNQDEKHPTRWYSTRQETEVAKKLGGKRTPNSGATMFMPNDVVADNWTIECKTCENNKKSFSIKKDWLDKLKEESILSNKPYEALVFNFGPDQKNYVVIDIDLFNLLKDALNKIEG